MISFHLSCTRCITILHVSIHDMISIFLLRHISNFFKFFLWHYNAAERMAPTLTISLAFLDIPIKLCKKKKNPWRIVTWYNISRISLCILFVFLTLIAASSVDSSHMKRIELCRTPNVAAWRIVTWLNISDFLVVCLFYFFLSFQKAMTYLLARREISS